MRLVTTLSALALVTCTVALSGCNASNAYCDLGAECDDGFEGIFLDPVPGSSDDSAGVCAANQQTLLNALRANREEVCHEAAAAWEIWMACAVEEGCDAFRIGEPECKDELDDYTDLLEDADNRCNE